MDDAARAQQEFLTADRLRAWSHVLGVAMIGCVAGYLAMSSGGFDANGKPLGTDYTSFYTASQLALAGRAAAAYDPALHHYAQNILFGRDIAYSAFFYPPVFLLVCLPMALLPYLWSLLVWQAATFAFYWSVVRRFAGPALDRLAIAAFPAVLITFGHGQNAFLSAGLFGAAILCLERRPLLAGMLFGCLAYKPQLALVIPVALIATRRWPTIASAGATVIGLCAVATAFFGVDIWRAFLANTPLAAAVLEQGLVEPFKLQSTYAAVRVLGGSSAAGYAIQAVVSLAVVVVLAAVSARAPQREMAAPLMVVAALLTSPYLLDYDLALLAIPLGWLFAQGTRTGFLPGEKVVGVLAFTLPLFARSIAFGAHLPLSPLVLTALFVVIARRALGAEPGREPVRLVFWPTQVRVRPI